MSAIGECNCGEVSYKVEGELSDVFVCHCSICRKSTGSGGIAVTLVKGSAFEWLSGKDYIVKWSKPDHDWHTFFCQICGSILPGGNDETQIYIPVGTLSSGHENLEVAHHLYTNSKANWEVISDCGKRDLSLFIMSFALHT
ncbi:Uncharacterized conserved protein [Alteromonadaceae bacterium Bs31]|nr:Uncharacterized conserved protein [Alteromonadaceae bacterium Bs31]